MAFAKIDQMQDDLVSIAFVSVGILTFIVGIIRYYQVKAVLETKDSDFRCALGLAGPQRRSDFSRQRPELQWRCK